VTDEQDLSYMGVMVMGRTEGRQAGETRPNAIQLAAGRWIAVWPWTRRRRIPHS
jgi:hypothetical protein